MKKITLGILFTFLLVGSGLSYASVLSSNATQTEQSDDLTDKDKDKKKKKKCCASKSEDGKKKCCSSEKKTEGESKPAEETK